ncbi:MAG: nucleotide sugar dehydrogenase [Myxococcales bacterium]|nr:nucleotide sugar dehydrogenase [Myxococcales bacterium]
MTRAQDLKAKIEAGEATVAVIGLGYVGLPLALAFAERGMRALGLDVDGRKVETLRAGRCYIEHIADARVAAALGGGASGRFEASEDFDRLAEADAIAICVPTPLSRQREPDLSYVESTGREVAARLRPGQLVVLESTTYPGTTDELLRSVLEASGLKLGEDFFLAFSPEREDPGNPQFHTTNIPKLVGGVDEASGDLAEALYRMVIGEVVRVSSARTAEAAKLTENIFRAVNIALVNELKVIYEPMGIDVWEVLDAAATKPFGFMRFNPGPGWGGHCIPLDPFYLTWKAREHGIDTKFIELAGEVNRGMPDYVVARLQHALNAAGKAVRGSTLMLLGMAYKKNVGDTRESPAFQILRKLHDLGAELSYHDPHVPEVPETRTWPGRPDLRSQALSPAQLAAQDAVVVVTDHDAVDYSAVLEHAPLIIDTRGVYRGAHAKVVKA